LPAPKDYEYRILQLWMQAHSFIYLTSEAKEERKVLESLKGISRVMKHDGFVSYHWYHEQK